ncbi:hypothetical protein BDFB_005196 [Asbolus verrucosus]|uniref:Uncharacterized protein n=1 Tax=Asbolus verrucosus TaxID=1661398 RepID=A0A482VE01_ASBVE|nr:hypothetical protein BDFB_005196 [Asbolus verrucosus]
MANLHRRKLEKHLYGGNPTGSLQKKGLHNTASVIGKINTASLWRVIAPYVTLSKKLYKLEETEDNAKFSYYLQKRPAVLLHDVSAYISDSVEVSSLFHETAEVLKTVTKAAGVTVYMVDRTNKEIYNSTIVGVDERHKVRWKIEEGTIVAAFVANRNEYVMVDDILTDERFPEGETRFRNQYFVCLLSHQKTNALPS